MIEITLLLPYIIGFIVLLIGSYSDLKTREVPDMLNYGLICVGLILALIFSIFFWDYIYILNSLVGLGLFFGLACLMFYTGQWGGGDSKMLMGLGALFGLQISNILDNFLVSFFVNMLIAGAGYGIIFSMYLAMKNWKNVKKEYKKLAKKKLVMILRYIVLILVIVFIFTFFYIQDFFFKIYVSLLIILVGVGFYSWMFVKIIEKACMFKLVHPNKLTEGDWIAKEIKIKGKVIAGPKDLGIEKKQIKKLITLYKQKKIKKVMIKEGIPFVPSFLIAYILTLIYGNLILLFF